MKNQMKRIVVIGLSTIVVMASSIAFATNVDKNLDTSVAWGNIDAMQSLNNNTMYEGTDIYVYEDEVNRIAAKYAVSGVENGQDLALRYVLRREALYKNAKKSGYFVTSEEVETCIKENMDFAQNAGGREYFDAYLEAAQMTEEEYWNSEREKIKKELVIGMYLKELSKKEDIALNSEAWEVYENKLVHNICVTDGIPSDVVEKLF